MPVSVMNCATTIDRTMTESAGQEIADTTEDMFLGGRLRLRQPRRGHRSGHDAILLASATPAKAGQRVVEFGAGVGVAGLSVARRVAGIDLTLVEIDTALAALAQANAEANQLQARIVVLDVSESADVFAASGLGADSADAVLMNPPFNDAARHRSSPDPARQAAHVAADDTLTAWIHAARRMLKSGGMLTLIWRADGLADILVALDRGFGSVQILPVHPKPQAPAIRVLVGAIKGGRAPLVLHPGLSLQAMNGEPDPEIQTILGGRAVLPLAKS